MSALRIVPTKHFLERLGERYFDLSVIGLLMIEANKKPHLKNFKVSSHNTTVVAAREAGGVIKLITGWAGTE